MTVNVCPGVTRIVGPTMSPLYIRVLCTTPGPEYAPSARVSVTAPVESTTGNSTGAPMEAVSMAANPTSTRPNIVCGASGVAGLVAGHGELLWELVLFDCGSQNSLIRLSNSCSVSRLF